MCMEDIRLGRETGYAVTAPTAPNGSAGVLCSPDQYRVGLIFSVAGAGVANVSPQNLAPSATVGIPVSATMPPIEFNIADNGAIVRDGWSGFGVGAGVVVTVIQISLEKK